MTHNERMTKAREYHAHITAERTELVDLRQRLLDSTETMRTIANMFSATVWRLLPQGIKAYFEEYRN